MARKDDKPLEGFDIISDFLTGDKSKISNEPTIDDGSFQDIDPEELEIELSKDKNNPSTKKVIKEDNVDDNDIKKSNKKNIKEDVEEVEDIDDKSDLSEEDKEYESDISSFFGAELIKKLGVNVEDEKNLKFEKIDDVLELMSEIIKENSQPVYASDEVAKYDEFVRNGGSLKEFYKDVFAGKLDIETADLENEYDQKAIIRENLLNQGYKEDKIKRMISRYEEAETLKEEAEDALDLLKDHNKIKTESLLEQQKKESAEAKKKQQRFYEDVNQTIKTISNFKGFPVSEKEKRELLEYAFLPDEDGATRYQKDFRGDVYHILESAYFTKNRNKIKAGDANKKEDTDAYKSLRDKLKARSNKTVEDNSKGKLSSGSLGDFGKGIIF